MNKQLHDMPTNHKLRIIWLSSREQARGYESVNLMAEWGSSADMEGHTKPTAHPIPMNTTSSMTVVVGEEKSACALNRMPQNTASHSRHIRTVHDKCPLMPTSRKGV